MIIAAKANRNCAITKGCELSNATLVAVEADDHRSAKRTPAAIHLYSALIVFILSEFKNKGRKRSEKISKKTKSL